MNVKHIDVDKKAVEAEKLYVSHQITIENPKQYVLDVVCGLKHLERNRVICHSDIKQSNIAYCPDTNNMKLIDVDDMHHYSDKNS